MNQHSSHSGTAGGRPARLRERLREATSDAILSAAERVFGEDGLHAARMERIASEAGVAVGTLYNHFEDKGALVAALMASRRQDLIDRLDAELAGADALAIDEQLHRFARALFEHAARHGRLLAALADAGEGPARPGNAVVSELQLRADALVARGIAAGALKPEAAEVLGSAFVGLARGLFRRELERPSGADAEAQASRLVDLFLRGAAR